MGVRNFEWMYDGTGYGALGKQTKFSTDSMGASAKFDSSGESDISIYLPSNSTVTDSSVKISGLLMVLVNSTITSKHQLTLMVDLYLPLPVPI